MKISSPSPEDNWLLNSSLLTFDLPILIDKMKHSHAWTKGELNSMILLESPDKQILLTTLHEGTVINSFQSNDSITFQIIEGKLKFHTRKGSAILDKSQSLTLHENIKYRLTTREETVLLLTMENNALQLAENQLPRRS